MVAAVLREEFERVSREEDIPMADLVAEIAGATGYSTRQIYNFRSGKWTVPIALVPALCKRFRSNALYDAIGAEYERVGEALSGDVRPAFENVNPCAMAIEVLREVIDHHNLILDSMKAGLTPALLARLEESTDRIVRRERALFSRAEFEYEVVSRKRAL